MKTCILAAVRLYRWRVSLLPAAARRACRAIAAPFRLYPIAGGEPRPGEPGAADPTTGTGGAGSGGGGGTGSPASGAAGGEPRSFTQDQVDAIVQERLARDRRDRPSDDEIANLRERAGKLDEIEAANRSELERAIERAEAAERERDDTKTTTQKALRTAEIRAAAATAGAIDAGEVYAILAAGGFKTKDKDGKELEVTVGDDGLVTGAKEAVEALLASKQHLVGNGTPDPGPGGGGARTTVSSSSLDEQIAEAEKAGDWTRAGRLKAQKLAQQTAG